MVGVDQPGLEDADVSRFKNGIFTFGRIILAAACIEPDHIPVVDMGFEFKWIRTAEQLHTGAGTGFVDNSHPVNLPGTQRKIKQKNRVLNPGKRWCNSRF